MEKHRWSRGVDIVKMSIPPKLLYTFNMIPVEAPKRLCGFRQDDPTMHREMAKELKIPKIIVGMRTEWEESL